MKKKLTKTVVEKESYPSRLVKNKAHYVWDTEISGFILRVYPSGKKKFVLRYRLPSTGRRRLYTLGEFPALSVASARQLAKEKLAEVYSGGDPAGDRETAAEGMTVGKLCDEYLTRYAEPRKKSVADDRSRINKHIITALGTRKIADIKRADIAKLHSKLGKKSIYVANRTLALLSVIFNQAILWGHLPEDALNPAQRIQSFREKSRERFLTREEAQVLLKHADKEKDPRIGKLIRLYLLTGARKQELLGLRWDDIDFDNQRLRFTDTKGGRTHWIKPSTEAWQILKAMKRFQEKDNPYVFTGRSEKTRMKGIKKPWERIRTAAKLPDVHLHDLRRTAASWLAQAGVSGLAIKQALGHSDLKMTEIYARMTAEDTAAPMATLGSLVGGLGT